MDFSDKIYEWLTEKGYNLKKMQQRRMLSTYEISGSQNTNLHNRVVINIMINMDGNEEIFFKFDKSYSFKNVEEFINFFDANINSCRFITIYGRNGEIVRDVINSGIEVDNATLLNYINKNCASKLTFMPAAISSVDFFGNNAVIIPQLHIDM